MYIHTYMLHILLGVYFTICIQIQKAYTFRKLGEFMVKLTKVQQIFSNEYILI